MTPLASVRVRNTVLGVIEAGFIASLNCTVMIRPLTVVFTTSGSVVSCTEKVELKGMSGLPATFAPSNERTCTPFFGLWIV